MTNTVIQMVDDLFENNKKLHKYLQNDVMM